LKEIKNEMQYIKALINNKNFKTALDVIINVKGQIKDINMFDTKELSKQVDSLRAEMYKETSK
jgi:hypothetical protein